MDLKNLTKRETKILYYGQIKGLEEALGMITVHVPLGKDGLPKSGPAQLRAIAQRLKKRVDLLNNNIVYKREQP